MEAIGSTVMKCCWDLMRAFSCDGLRDLMNLMLHGGRGAQVMKYSWDLMRHGDNRKHGNEIQLGFNARSFRVTVLVI